MQQTNLKNRFIRLVKVISHSGYCSRREAEGLITSGKVLLNGNPYKEFLIQPEEIKKLSINGKKLSMQKTRLWCFNKSTGLICSNSNQYGKKTIAASAGTIVRVGGSKNILKNKIFDVFVIFFPTACRFY